MAAALGRTVADEHRLDVLRDIFCSRFIDDQLCAGGALEEWDDREGKEPRSLEGQTLTILDPGRKLDGVDRRVLERIGGKEGSLGAGRIERDAALNQHAERIGQRHGIRTERRSIDRFTEADLYRRGGADFLRAIGGKNTRDPRGGGRSANIDRRSVGTRCNGNLLAPRISVRGIDNCNNRGRTLRSHEFVSTSRGTEGQPRQTGNAHSQARHRLAGESTRNARDNGLRFIHRDNDELPRPRDARQTHALIGLQAARDTFTIAAQTLDRFETLLVVFSHITRDDKVAVRREPANLDLQPATGRKICDRQLKSGHAGATG